MSISDTLILHFLKEKAVSRLCLPAPAQLDLTDGITHLTPTAFHVAEKEMGKKKSP